MSMNLERGFDMAQLSGDVDKDGKAEIWTVLLEEAFAQMVGGYENIDNGGNPASFYSALTGSTPSAMISTSGKTNSQIWNEINNPRGQGRTVILNTKVIQPDPSPVKGHHAYLIIGVSAAGYDLYNPWGTDHAELSMDRLTETIESYVIL